ncbi:hypothetical protein EJB05_36884, partial [Eragrostis curvula]
MLVRAVRKRVASLKEVSEKRKKKIRLVQGYISQCKGLHGKSSMESSSGFYDSTLSKMLTSLFHSTCNFYQHLAADGH